MNTQEPKRGASLVRGAITELDGLRGLAILFVILHHFWPEEGVLAPFSGIAHLGWIGVDLFFVISGFLITGILLDSVERPLSFRIAIAEIEGSLHRRARAIRPDSGV